MCCQRARDMEVEVRFPRESKNVSVQEVSDTSCTARTEVSDTSCTSKCAVVKHPPQNLRVTCATHASCLRARDLFTDVQDLSTRSCDSSARGPVRSSFSGRTRDSARLRVARLPARMERVARNASRVA